MDAFVSQPHCAKPGLFASRSAIAAAILISILVLQLLGLLAIGRRLVGAMERPAPIVLLVVAAFASGLVSWLSRRLWRILVSPRESSRARGLEVLVGWGPSLAIILLTFGLCGSMDRYIDWLVWMPLWVADVLWRQAFLAGEPMESLGAGIDPSTPLGHTPPPSVAAAGELEDRSDGVVLQQVTRLRDADGRELVAGVVRADFLVGQRTTEVYVGFCPPFAGMPSLECEETDGPPARITVGQILPHGARIDVRLDTPAAAAEYVLVDIFASL